MIRSDDALQYHGGDRPGIIEVKGTRPCLSPREMRLAYLPGAAFPAAEIARDPTAAFRYTARGNLVAVVTNGTAVPGLGDVGPSAAKPMQEGVAVLFKRLADIDVFDLELDAASPGDMIETVRRLTPTFGGINLKDIRAPEGLEIYERLVATLPIPVFHENLYSTAVVAMAALVNALELVEKTLDAVRVVICGAGTVGLGCARLVTRLGVPRENILCYDVHGLLHPARGDLNRYQAAFARDDGARTLAAGLKGADVFLGASAAGVLTAEMIRSMNRYPVVFAMATPEPEISYEAARASRRDVIVATGLGQDPNAIVDLLSFPYIFRGALDVGATRITEGMMLAAARALSELAREDVIEEVSRAYGNETYTFGPEYLLPKPIDPRVLVRESSAVARAAMEEGVAARPVEASGYEDRLTVRLGTGREIMRRIILKARTVAPRVVFPEGANETVLRACAILVDEGIAAPVLLGDPDRVRESADRVGLDLGGTSIVDPARAPRYEDYARDYFQLRGRRGVTHDMALHRLTDPRYFACMMLHGGDADMMIAGVTAHYTESMRTVLEVIGPAPGTTRIASVYMVLRPERAFFLADCTINISPDAPTLAEIALHSARLARSLGIEPRVAMLSFSNFGSSDHPFARRVREATRIAQQRAPGLAIDGEVQPRTALDGEVRRRFFPFSELPDDANVLIFPDLQSGNLALQLLERLGESVAVGPVLMGTRLPVHLLQYGSRAEDVVNLAAIAAVEAGSRARPAG